MADSSSSSSSTNVLSSPLSSFTFSTFTPIFPMLFQSNLIAITSYCGALNFCMFCVFTMPWVLLMAPPHVHLNLFLIVMENQLIQDVWQSLEKAYSAQSRAKIMNLKYQLHTLKKGSLSMSDYFQKKKSIVDNLAVVAQPVSDFDLASSLLSGLLSGLSSEYEAIITSITTRVEPISLDDLTGFLLSQEARLKETSATVEVPITNLATHSLGTYRARLEETSTFTSLYLSISYNYTSD
ncbi:hypothetical protein AAC387_Pa08g0670 [Persea americana]